MAKDYNDSLSTPTIGPGSFGAEAPVNSEGSSAIAAIGDAAGAAADISNLYVLNKYQKEASKAEDETTAYYEAARELKQGIFEAGIRNDQAQEARFVKQLSDLKIAERQGAISSSNSATRQEALFKSYATRFPHLEESFRKSFSSTRARAEAQREQFTDPTEEGQDALIKEAYSQGMSVGAYVQVKQKTQQLELNLKNLELKAKLGQAAETEIDDIFQSQLVPLASGSAQSILARQVKAVEASGLDYDAGKIKAEFILQANVEVAAIAGRLNEISRSAAPGATFSREFLNSRLAQVRKVFDDITNSGVFESYDTLNAMKRAMEVGSINSLIQLGKYSPVLAEIAKRNPEQAGEIIFKDFAQTLELYKKGRRDVLAQLGSSPNAIDAGRLNYQIAIIDQWQGQELARDYVGFTEHGVPPEPTGDQDIDAPKVSILAKAVLGSNKTTPEEKKSAIAASVLAEKRNKKTGESPGPSSVWYKDPVRLRAVRSDPESSQLLVNYSNDSALGAIEELTRIPQARTALKFEPKIESDVKQPWTAYEGGGPFVISGQDGGARVGASGRPAPPRGMSGPYAQILPGLNNSYWTYRSINGPAAANKWAEDILATLSQNIIEKEEAELAQKTEAATAKGESFDIDLTD